jgi:hypothetical protein
MYPQIFGVEGAHIFNSVVLASIARLVLFLIFKSSQNVTQVIIFGHLASSADVCLAIIAACLPSCAPLLKRTLQRFVSTKRTEDQGNTDDTKKSALVTIGQKRSRGPASTTVQGGHDEGSFERLDDSGSFQGSTDGLYINGSGPNGTERKSGVWKEVHIRREFEVGSENGDIPMRNV